MTLPAHMQQQLDHPVDPDGRPIEWEHPFLVFLAEHGRIPSSEERERECVEIVKTGRSVSKSTSMALDPTKPQVLRNSGLIIPPSYKREEYMVEFFAYQTVGIPANGIFLP